MDAIIFKDNVYVYIRRKECKDENIGKKKKFLKFQIIIQTIFIICMVVELKSF